MFSNVAVVLIGHKNGHKNVQTSNMMRLEAVVVGSLLDGRTCTVKFEEHTYLEAYLHNSNFGIHVGRI